MEYKYPALLVRQSSSDKTIALFASPASEIDRWAGIPQKKRFVSGEESLGFQREENKRRIADLSTFFADQENLIQNPLLCATRIVEHASVSFDPIGEAVGQCQPGTITISAPNYDTISMAECLSRVRAYLEARVPELASQEIDANIFAQLKLQLNDSGVLPSLLSIYDDEHDSQEIDDQECIDYATDEGSADAALFEESHIFDFWMEVAARDELAKLIDAEHVGDYFLGFSKTALISYLMPIVLVDGQHRLRGALSSAADAVNSSLLQDEIEKRIANGEDPGVIENEIFERSVRNLPVSLLMSHNPEEQVFQFVVVNQKATPISPALLRTIISTTLSDAELERVAKRLRKSGIQLDESQVIKYLAKFPQSPFCSKIEIGSADDTEKLLQWSVIASLVSLFRELKGGKLWNYGNDYADAWKRRYLEGAGIVQDWASEGASTAFEFWSQPDGPWRDVFIRFYTCIREEFGNTSSPDAANYWGNPRSSNLFNKISLTILGHDWFQFLVDTRQGISSPDDVEKLVSDWLLDVDRIYFNRDWDLAETKKDAVGTRKQWAYLWVEYRKNPTQLPQRRLYRVNKD
ncbi:MAG: hypothetical protein K9L32_04715 [Chromatiaceae bacterium]|nr:hypothetical protein [Chromatiaceae bacterium]MCF8003501.1 hypothetical protein [Chromatiaceae bacterium]